MTPLIAVWARVQDGHYNIVDGALMIMPRSLYETCLALKNWKPSGRSSGTPTAALWHRRTMRPILHNALPYARPLIDRKFGIHIPTPRPDTANDILHPPSPLALRILRLQRPSKRARRDEAVVPATAKKVDLALLCWTDDVLGVFDRVLEECLHGYICASQ